MKPEELKARELVGKFRPHVRGLITSEHREYAKQCALICCDEILKLDVWDSPHNAEQGLLFYESVKEAIQNI
jgi:hypothetical protein